MDQKIIDLYKRWGADERTLKPIRESWDETLRELSERNIDVNRLTTLIEQSEGKESSVVSFGEHVLHKLTKAVSVIRGFNGESRKYCMQSVASDLTQIIEYASKTELMERSFRGCVQKEKAG